MKHTPGPWSETDTEDGTLIVRMDKSHMVVIGDLELTCEECHGNAHLITAAPDLLEALERLLAKYELDQLKPIDWYHAAQAVQKAKGEK